MGARIAGAGTDRIVDRRRARLHGATHAIMPDRIETGTFVAAIAAAGGEATVARHARPTTLDAVLGKLAEAGADIDGDGRRDPRDAARAARAVQRCARRRTRAFRPTCRRR